MKHTHFLACCFCIAFMVACNRPDLGSACSDEIIMLSSEFKSWGPYNFDCEIGVSELPAAYPPDLKTVTEFENITSIDPLSTTHNAIYDPETGEYTMLMSREGILIQYNLAAKESHFSRLSAPSNYVAPVLLKGTYYAISVIPETEDTATFAVLSIDPTNGSVLDSVSLSMDTAVHKSAFNAETMSSATDGKSKLYFISGTNMITVNIATGTVFIDDIDRSYTEWVKVSFHGLEFMGGEDEKFIAIRKRGDWQELVSIDLSGFGIEIETELNLLYDINFAHYSSAFSACRNTYYLTSLYESTLTGRSRTRYAEIRLDDNSINDRVIIGFLYGLAVKE